MDIRAAIVVFGMLAAGPVLAQTVTVCQGTSSCVEVDGGSTRQLSEAELRWKNLNDAHTAIGNINCSVATDPDRCRQLISELYEVFR